VIRGVDLVNKPATTIDGYTANQKTMVQNMFNSKNLNENLNFKNTYYLAERGDIANKETNTIYGYEKVYPTQVVDADLKAQYAAKVWKDMHIKSEKKVKEAFRQTMGNVAKIKENEEKIKAEEQAKHAKAVRGYFKTVQQLVGTMTGAPKEEKFNIPCTEDEGEAIGAQNIDRNANDEEKILNNRANIRALMGARSVDNQERKQADIEAKAKIVALEQAQKDKVVRQEEMRMSKYMDLQKLSQTWRIPDTDKLKGVVRNEIMKNIIKEEERKNFEKMGQNMRKSESPKRSLIKKQTKSKIEPPKAYSPTNKKKEQKKEEKKKYAFNAEKVHKLPKETQDDYRTRFNYTVMALPEQKEALDPVEQHQIMKKFQEMIVKSGVEKNGRLVLEAKK